MKRPSHRRRAESIPLDLINPPVKWRWILEANIDILTESMGKNGQLEPIGLVPAKDTGRYDIIWGEHRRLASMKLNRTHIDTIVLEDVGQAQGDLITLDENIARNGYSCVLEEASARAKNRRGCTWNCIPRRDAAAIDTVVENQTRIIRLWLCHSLHTSQTQTTRAATESRS